MESLDGGFVEVVGFLEREEEFGRGGGSAVGVVVGAITVVIVVASAIAVIAMAFRWIDDVEGLGFDDGIFDGGKYASFYGRRWGHSRGTGTTGLASTRDGIASPSSSSRSGTALTPATMAASTSMSSLSVVTLRLRGIICFFAKIVARIRRRGAEGAAGAILGGIGGVVQTGIAAVVGGIAFGGAASSSSVSGATGGAGASSGGGMAAGASIPWLLLVLLFGTPIVTMSAGNGILDGAQPPSSCDFGG